MTAEVSSTDKVSGASALTSVIMVSYQTGPVLMRAVAHVLEQTLPVQLCLVDNGNPPEVVAAFKDMAVKEPRLNFITGHGNIGFSRGCNLGARAAEGHFLLFLNPDSLLPSNALDLLLQHAERLRSPFMLGARLLNEDGSDQRGCRRALLTPKTALIEALHLQILFPRDRLNFNTVAVPEYITSMPAISGAFMFLPRQDFWSINGFDEAYFLHVEDLDFCFRLRQSRGEIYFVPEVIVTHVGHTSHVTNAFIEKHKARGFMRYFHTHFCKNTPKLLLWLLDIAIWSRAFLKIARSSSK